MSEESADNLEEKHSMTNYPEDDIIRLAIKVQKYCQDKGLPIFNHRYTMEIIYECFE